MANITTAAPQAGAPEAASPPRRGRRLDLATLVGAIGAFTMIGLAMILGGAPASFVNLPSLLLVVGGTFLVTTMSFSLTEVARAQRVMLLTAVYHDEKPSTAAAKVLYMATIARQRGKLALQGMLRDIAASRFLTEAIELVVDGLPAEEIDRVLRREADATHRRHLRAAAVLRRAGEVSPAMGLIGTLVGLIQMLGQLDDPSAIGPAMAIALLTTFYGAVMSNMIFLPLASKLERNSQAEAMVHQIYSLGAVSISRQENPRRLEMLINTILPPHERINTFD